MSGGGVFPDYQALFTRLSGKRPSDLPEEYRRFFEEIQAFTRDYRNAVLDEAHSELSGYQPIPTSDMKPAYRRGFEDTKIACGLRVLRLKVVQGE